MRNVLRAWLRPTDAPAATVPSLRAELRLPHGVSEAQLFDFVSSVLVADAPVEEMRRYCTDDFRRFVHTYGLVADERGTCLELGSNPYFTTMLLKQFTDLKLVLANFFSPEFSRQVVQEVTYRDPVGGEKRRMELESQHFNIEGGPFPFESETFDVVLFCEILEHLISDPIAVLREIKRILKANGTLVLTTPNVNRLENVAAMIAGDNIYDQYSGYGPYGRHNREYSRAELQRVLDYMGFDVLSIFTADVHDNGAARFGDVRKLVTLLGSRRNDLGQYTFVKARNARPAGTRRPAFLYRSYAPDELDAGA